MDTFDEMLKHGVMLRHTKTVYNWLTKFYIIFGAFFIVVSLVYSFVSITSLFFLVLIDCVIFKTTFILCGFLACYKHDNRFVLFNFINQLICLGIDLFFGRAANVITMIIVLPILVITFISNNRYTYLSQQYGFPHFNQRTAQQEMDRIQYNIKSEYQQTYERFVKNRPSDDMSDISAKDMIPPKDNPMTLEKKSDEKSAGSMDTLDF